MRRSAGHGELWKTRWKTGEWGLRHSRNRGRAVLQPSTQRDNPFAVATAALSRAARSIDFRLLTLSFGICGFSISTAPWPARRSIQTTALRQHPAFEQKLHRVFGTSL